MTASRAGLGIEGYDEAVLVAEGGFARVYRARQPAFDRLVAVKVLSKVALDERAMRQFARERAAIGSLSGHPNIVTVYDAGLTDAGFPYLAMEYLPNGSLADRLDRDGPVDWEEMARIGVRLAGALESAHLAGILHRDVKPENVMMTGFGEPQLTDFGIARVLTGPETRTVNQAVSVAHAAPEVLNGEPFTRRSDIYSLGSTLFTLLWGCPPFLRDDDELLLSLLVRITTLPPPDLRARGVPDAVCQSLERSMAKRPADRQGSALELAEDLQRAEVTTGARATVPYVIGAPPHAGTEAPARGAAATVQVPPPSAPTQDLRGSGRKGRWLLVGLPLVLAVVALAVWRSAGDRTGGAAAPPVTAEPTTSSIATTSTTLAAVPFPSGADPVPPGRYVATRFSSPFEFELPEGWRAAYSSVGDQLELVRTGDPSASTLTFMRISRVFDSQLAPTTPGEAGNAVRDAPADLVQWLRAHPRLTTVDAKPVVDGALTGSALGAQVSLGYRNPDCETARPGARCVLLFANTDTLSYALSEGFRAAFHVLRLGTATLVAAVEAPVAEFDRFSAQADQVLSTLRPPG